jgi:uncharacterized protein with HEPN domain
LKDDKVLSGHIHDAIERIEMYVAAGYKEFSANLMMQDAVIRNFEVIGEAVKGLSQDLKDRHPGIPWKQIAGMRDFLIHVYFGVKLETVWLTIQRDLPPLKDVVTRELA